MVPMLTISHIGITASTYLITFAAIERYCITVNSNKVAFLQHHRKTIAFIAVMAGMISKGTMLEEVTIRTNPQCIGMFNEWEVKPSDLVIENVLFNKIWRFYFRLQAHSSLSKSSTLVEDKQSFKQKKARIRAATRTLIILVCTYLMSNLLSVIITIWEYLDAASLFQKYLPFYVLSVALLSLLTVIASCLRLPIYITCQPLLRKEMYQFLCEFCFFG
nr:Protein C47E8.3 [Haemonchus contortus]